VHQIERSYFDEIIHLISFTTVVSRFINRGILFAMSHHLQRRTRLLSPCYETLLHSRKSFRRIHKVILFGSHFYNPKRRTSSAGHKYLSMIHSFITTHSYHCINSPLFFSQNLVLQLCKKNYGNLVRLIL
jgi:hypothetical protein